MGCGMWNTTFPQSNVLQAITKATTFPAVVNFSIASSLKMKKKKKNKLDGRTDAFRFTWSAAPGHTQFEEDAYWICLRERKFGLRKAKEKPF
jgi:hypothetical protein